MKHIENAIVSMPTKFAREAAAQYLKAVRKRHSEEDRLILKTYREIIKGRQILDLGQVFANLKCDRLGRPPLAICQADQRHVLYRGQNRSGAFAWDKGAICGSWPDINWRAKNYQIKVPLVSNNERSINGAHRGIVPIVPPALRPNTGLHLYHILWEVDHWERVPGDPILLKRIDGLIFAVVAQWDLTPVERAVLSATRSLA